MQPPFSSWVFHADNGSLLRTLTPNRRDLERLGVEELLTPGWVAGPALPVHDGFLQSFADLRSNLRIHLHMNGTGRIWRGTRDQSGTSFVMADPQRAQLAGLRRDGSLSLHWFTWSIDSTP